MFQQAHHQTFTTEYRYSGYAHIDIVVTDAQPNAPILGQTTLCNIQVSHDLDAGDDGGCQFDRRRIGFAQDTVDAVPDA